MNRRSLLYKKYTIVTENSKGTVTFVGSLAFAYNMNTNLMNRIGNGRKVK